MPIRRIRKPKRKPARNFKRRFKRRLYKRSGTVQALKSTVCPDRLIVTLPYSDVFVRTPGLANDDYVFNLNSIFDPDRTGTGHQPLGRDQWNNFYNRYRVISCTADIYIKNLTTGTGLMFGVVGNNESTPINNTAAIEQSHSKFMMVGQSTGKDTIHLRRKFYNPRITGRTAMQYMADDTYGAVFSSNPSEIICLHCVGYDPAGTQVSYQMNVRLLYTCEFYDRVPLSQS